MSDLATSGCPTWPGEVALLYRRWCLPWPADIACSLLPRHCEERSDEAIQWEKAVTLDCFASLAMTGRPLAMAGGDGHNGGGYRHCEERSDEAIQTEKAVALDCRASLAMTMPHEGPAEVALPTSRFRPAGQQWVTLLASRRCPVEAALTKVCGLR
ncbi:MAG: hypothetical protein LBT00_06630 [Spirochaetaceae bacterium]|nr:hypothetical protein [Spirochaetaceae bacterium]